MGECIIASGRSGYVAGSGGSLVNKPELDPNFPKDIVDAGIGYTYTLNCFINTYYNNCTYQWYKDDIAIEGATESTYEYTPDTKGSCEIYCIISNDIYNVSTRKATITCIGLWLIKDGQLNTNVVGGLTYINASTSNYRIYYESDCIRFYHDGVSDKSYGYLYYKFTNDVPSGYNYLYGEVMVDGWIKYQPIDGGIIYASYGDEDDRILATNIGQKEIHSIDLNGITDRRIDFGIITDSGVPVNSYIYNVWLE